MAEEYNAFNSKLTTDFVLNSINNPEIWDNGAVFNSLDEFLQETDWSGIASESIIPKYELRSFCKRIFDKEVRLAVMKFLHEYARYYFYDSACNLANDSLLQLGWNPSNNDIENRADDYMVDFQSELATQISQIEKTGEYSGNKFSALEKKVTELEKQVKTLKDENKKISDELYFIKHPEEFGKHIPIELNDQIFINTMSYLISKRLATSHDEHVSYGFALNSYYWYGSKSLFGYFVDRISHELELRDSGGRLNWKPFKCAFVNFDDLIDEARNAVSKYTQNKRARKPEQADIIENAIKYACQMKGKEEARSKKNAESR